MLQIKRLFTGLIFCFLHFSMSGQTNNDPAQFNSRIDSLLSLLKTAKEDTNKVNILYELSEECSEEDILKYAQAALLLAEKLNYKKGVAVASNNIGYVYYTK